MRKSETESIIYKLNKRKEALDFYSNVQNRNLLVKQLKKGSKLVAMDSLEVLYEFEQIKDEGQAI